MRALSTLLPSALIQTLTEAVDSLRTLGKRSALALLGIVIGSASIIAVINIGHNARHDVALIFQDMGVDSLSVLLADRPGTQESRLSFDIEALNKLDLGDLLIAPAAIVSLEAGFNRKTADVRLVGTLPSLFEVMKLSMNDGRFLHTFDQSENAVVLGHKVAVSLSEGGTRIRVGDWLRLKNYLFKVVGVLQPRPESMLSPIFVDDSVFVPLQGLARVAAEARINDLIVRIPPHNKSASVVPTMQDRLTRAFMSRTIEVITPQQMIEGMNRQSRTFHYLLMALGGITLVGGGVAVMNIMYMNVYERRIEIGLRMAIGARRHDIRNLFLIEAVVLSTTGAVLGAGLGMVLAYVYARVSGWAFDIAANAIPLGVISTVAVGVFFGLKPAIAASRLPPVEALRDY